MTSIAFALLLTLSLLAYAWNRQAAGAIRAGGGRLHSLTTFHGLYALLLVLVPVFLLIIAWLALQGPIIERLLLAGLPEGVVSADLPGQRRHRLIERLPEAQRLEQVDRAADEFEFGPNRPSGHEHVGGDLDVETGIRVGHRDVETSASLGACSERQRRRERGDVANAGDHLIGFRLRCPAEREGDVAFVDPGIPERVVHHGADVDVARWGLGLLDPVRRPQTEEEIGERLRRGRERLDDLVGAQCRVGDHLSRSSNRVERRQHLRRGPVDPQTNRGLPEAVGGSEMHGDVPRRPSVATARMGPLVLGEFLDHREEASALTDARSGDRRRVSVERDDGSGSVARCEAHLPMFAARTVLVIPDRPGTSGCLDRR